MFPKSNGYNHSQSYHVLCLVFSAWLLLIIFPCFSWAQLETTVSLNFSDNGGTVTINKQETIGIILQSNLTADYQWMLDTAGLNTDVVGEIGVFDLSVSGSEQSDSNNVEPNVHFIQWIFAAKDSGSAIDSSFSKVTQANVPIPYI